MFKVYVLSDMAGRVLKDGVPLANAKVSRLATYNSKTFSDSAITNPQGEFVFSAKSTRSLLPIMFETVIYQEMWIEHEETRFLGYKIAKRDPGNKEDFSIIEKYKGKLKDINLDCELSNNADQDGEPLGVCRIKQ